MQNKTIQPCPNCRQKLRIPSDKKVRVTCPTCKSVSVFDLRPRDHRDATASPQSPISGNEPPQNDADNNLGCFVILAVIGVGIILGFMSGFIFITDSGCTLPVDVVIGDTCLGGSFGGSVGLTIIATIAFGLIAFAGSVLLAILRGIFTRR